MLLFAKCIINVWITNSFGLFRLPYTIFIGPRCPWGPIYGFASLKQTNWATCANLTDVTLADDDTNSILTDNANRTFQGNVAMQVTQLCCQIWNQAMQVTSPDYQILNQFARNQKMHILQQIRKCIFKRNTKLKYCKSDVEKCNRVSIEI